MTKNIKIGLLMVAAMMVAVMFSGCSSNDFVEEIELEDMPIEFSSSTKNTTRAAISNNSDLANAGGFSVWGWKTTTQSPLDWSDKACYQVFNGVNVYSNGDNHDYVSGDDTNWTYATKKYWDRKSTYCFYAAAPASSKISMFGESNNAKLFKITGATSMSSTADGCNDFMITRSKVQRAGTDNTNVDLTFHHVMSKVALKFQAGINNCKIVVDKVVLSGWSNVSYDFTQSASYTAGANMSEWTVSGSSSANKAGSAEFASSTAFGNNNFTVNGSTETLPTEADASSYWIMTPQSVETLTFTVNYTIYYEDGTYDSFEGVTGTLTNQNWYTDCCTTYTLTISPQPIKFNVSSVSWSGNSDASVIVQ